MTDKKFSTRFAVIIQLIALLNVLMVSSSSQSTKLTPDVIYSNPTSISIPSAPIFAGPRPATVYPSNITVSGMSGTITRVANP